MRLLHLGKYYAPYRGGMETVLQNLCEAHAGRAEVLALVGNQGRRTLREEVNGVPVIRAGCLGAPLSVPVVPSFPYWLRKLRPDVVVHHEPNPAALLAYLAARPPGAFVFWFHSDIVRQRVFYNFYRPFLRTALRRAQAIVVASPNHVRHTPVLGEFADKCCVVPYGIDLRRFQATPQVEARARAIRSQSDLPVIVFIGRFAYYKGLVHLMDAMREVRARLILGGRGPLDREIRLRAAALATEARIECVGELTDNEVVALLHACDVFVLPSIERSEAFGVVQLEAMACGKPVVSCRIPSGVPWVNRDEETGLTVPPGDPGSLATALNRLLGDVALQRKLGGNGRARVEQEFTLERMRDSFWEVLCEAKAGRAARVFRYRPEEVTHR